MPAERFLEIPAERFQEIPAELKELMTSQPFGSFTVIMSDGTHVTTDDGETTEHLYLLHVTRIQRQEQAA